LCSTERGPTLLSPLSLHDALPISAHYIVTKKLGFQPDTKEYFEAVEKELGLREPDEVEVVEQKKPQQTRRTIPAAPVSRDPVIGDRKSTRLNSSHVKISYAVFCLK